MRSILQIFVHCWISDIRAYHIDFSRLGEFTFVFLFTVILYNIFQKDMNRTLITTPSSYTALQTKSGLIRFSVQFLRKNMV